MSLMKWIVVVCAVSFSAVGCASLGGAIGATYDEGKLKERVSFDTNCPVEKVSIVKKQDDGMAGTGKFVMNACGKNVNYVRLGRSYFSEADSPLRR